MSDFIYPNFLGDELRLPYYPVGIGIYHNQEPAVRPWGYHQYQWIQCRSGSGELYIGEKRYVIGENQGFLLFPHFPKTDEPHQYRSLGGDWITDWVIFDGSGIADFFKNVMNISESKMLYVSEPERIRNKIELLFDTVKNVPIKSVSCSSITYEILLDIMTLTSEKENGFSAIKREKIAPVIDYINKNYSRELTLNELAEVAGLTPQYLCSLFKSVTSKTVFEYICLTKLQKSKELLLTHTNMMVKTVAELSGFNDKSYFCAVFKKYEKMSPTDFRRLHVGI